jgi:hypothetical protein
VSYGKATAYIAEPGVITVVLSPTPRVRAAFARHRSLELPVEIALSLASSSGASPPAQHEKIIVRAGEGGAYPLS